MICNIFVKSKDYCLKELKFININYEHKKIFTRNGGWFNALHAYDG